jgi:YggT family protein
LGLGDFIFSVTEPILAPIRRALPMAAGMDFSPLVALLLLNLVERLLHGILPPAF